LINLIRSAAGHIKTGDFASLESVDASSYGLVVITKDKDRGYNSACRLGVMITGAYAGNGASRHQIRGRLRRLGQKRSVVKFVTFVMENSLLHLLHLRHNAVDSMNISLEQLGQSFSADVLKGLQPGALPFCSSVAQKPSPVKYAQTKEKAASSVFTAPSKPAPSVGGREMKGLVNRRPKKGAVEFYKVRWRGAGKEEDSWVGAELVSEALIRKYEAAIAEPAAGKRKRD